jgi:hypothetical protein
MTGLSNEYLFFSKWSMALPVGFAGVDFHCFCFRRDDQVVVISPHWDGIKLETARAFSAWHEEKYVGSATIRWREASGGGSQIVRFLRSKYK